MLHYFRWSFGVTIIGLFLAFWLGWENGGLNRALGFLFIGLVLSVLEISLSFDNAIVNANKLKSMTPLWQRRFLTWGILIAVFGMRIVFPMLIVVIAARIGPLDAINLSLSHPEKYAQIIGSAHLGIAAFGGAFLMMVALSFFCDCDKDVHWLGLPERAMSRCGNLRGLSAGVVVLIALIFGIFVPQARLDTYGIAVASGLGTFLAVDWLSGALDAGPEAATMVAKGGFGAFLYLEVLDASFSFDGVIGAFALTQNPVLIAIGLGIGAMFVRSMTIMLVEKQSLAVFRYLESGAFWSILVLSAIMFAQTAVHIPEVVTGLLGAGFILASLWASVRYNRQVG